MLSKKKLPKVIQGGMGVGVSGWKLANAVSRLGQLGVVSGTALDCVLVRKLQSGDLGNSIREALKNFPNKDTVSRILDKYFRPKTESQPRRFKNPPMLLAALSKELQELLVVSNFVEVFLAKKGHSGPVGINYLEKIQMAMLPSLYGAMLAGVTYVLVGAGIPKEIPGVLDKLARNESVQLQLDVENAPRESPFYSHFSPSDLFKTLPTSLVRPNFIPIVSSATLAESLVRKSSGKVDGVIFENSIAGGHNAPPRGHPELNPRGEPVYGPRDQPNLEQLKSLSIPFWLAGGYGTPEGLQKALSEGASGVQVGSAFALCEESGLREDWKKKILQLASEKKLEILTDPMASPTGFPFKIAQMEGTLSESKMYSERCRSCDMGYLRKVFQNEKGQLSYRCPAEPLEQYLSKGGTEEKAQGRKCLCNALLANIGLGQFRENGYEEKPLFTIGNQVSDLSCFVKPGINSYTAKDVIQTLLPSQDVPNLSLTKNLV